MVVSYESFIEHFDRNFNAIKEEMYNQWGQEYRSFMREERTTQAFIKRAYMGGLGMPRPNRDLQDIPFVMPPKGPESVFTPVNYRLGYQIEKQTIEQEQWGLLANRPRSMLYGANVLMDITGANILNNGFTNQTYDFDPSGTAKPLFNTAHTREDGMSTWANQIATDLPITVETVMQAIISLLWNIEDSTGLPIAYGGTFNLIVPSTSPALVQQAVEVVNSIMNPGTSDNKINAATKQFKLNLVVGRYLTNTAKWFVGWTPDSTGYGLLMVINLDPEISPLKESGLNCDCWWSRLRCRFVAGYENKRGIAAVGS